MTNAIDYMKSPVGFLRVTSDGNVITHIEFTKKEGKKNPDSLTTQCIQELAEYFAKARKEFSVPMKAEGTDFQKAVWKVMTGIAVGKTLSYADVAKKIGRPKAVRAVGTACGANPLVVAVPCHRILASGGGMGGFGGGIPNKKWLLSHEGALT